MGWLDKLSQDMAASSSNPLLRGAPAAAAMPSVQANPLLGSGASPPARPAAQPMTRDEALNAIHRHAGWAPPTPSWDGQVHVVSTVHPDTHKKKVHGVFVNLADADNAHKEEVRKAYAAMRANDYDDGERPRRASREGALKKLIDREWPAPTLQSVAVGGTDMVPGEVSLVHETAAADDGNMEMRIHGAHVFHPEMQGKAERIAKMFYENGNEEYRGELSDADVARLNKAWISAHPKYATDENFDLVDKNAPQDIKDAHEAAFMRLFDEPLPFRGLKQANRHQRNVENMGRGLGRAGIFDVTRHPVIT